MLEGITVNGKPLGGCTSGKIQHVSHESAAAHAKSIQEKDGHLPNIYSCQECGYLHVGGGRRSDQPIRRPVPIITTPKPVFIPKKIDKGHQVSTENLVLEKLRTSLLTDVEIARMFNTNYSFVQRIRLSNKIPNSHQRKNNAVLDLLAANPRRNRKEIARILKIKLSRVYSVAQKLGLAGQGERVRGVKHRFFGTRQSKFQKQFWADHPELRAKLSEAVKTKQWAPSEKSAARRQWLKDYNRSPEVRARRSEFAKQQWAKRREAQQLQAAANGQSSK
jgi:hypothetical protein